MNVAIIPARGGSKRIPYKNIKLFNGKPIIAYSIESAIKSNCFERIIVSTDDEEIASISEDYGAEVPFIRPKDLANDYIGTMPVIKHAIESIEQNEGLVENVCCIYATAPFVQPQAIKDAYRQLKTSQAEYCFTVTSYAFPIQRAIKLSKQQRVEMFHPQHFNTRSQDLEEAYHDAGQFYWGTAQAFKDEKALFSKHSVPYVLPRYLVQDIDTREDWIQAELMYQVLKKTRKV